MSDLATHIVIPDSQIAPGVPLDFLNWIGRYIVESFAGKENIKIIHLGDFADMESLSSYDVGKREMEGRRYKPDILVANHAWGVLNQPFMDYNAVRKQYREKRWNPERHILLGNHEDRINRAISSDAKLEGTISTDNLEYAKYGWAVHPFLKPLWLDGIGYAHYWYNPMSGRPFAGNNVETRLKQIGHSFTMGHQQTLLYGVRYVTDKSQHGLVAGACYMHDEAYKGYQGNAHWRGIIIKHQVEDGQYDPMFVSLDYLCRRYTGKRLALYKPKVYASASD